MASTKNAEASLVKLEGQGAKLGTTFTTTQSNSDRFRSSLQQFDGVLASLGANIGTEVRAFGELGEAAGKTAGELGAIATAGFVVAAAMAGWKLGRLAAEFFDLDQKIGAATAKMLGWGDVGAQVAGAQQDVITRAIERGAAATISYTDALQFNTDWLKKRQGALIEDEKAQKANADEQRKLNAEAERWGLIMAELNTAGGNWWQTLQGINGTVVEAVKFYLQAGVSQGTLATAYGLTAVQIKAVATAMSEELQMAKILADFSAQASANQAVLDARAMKAIEDRTAAMRAAAAEAEAFNKQFLADALATALAADALLFGKGVDSSVLHSGQRGAPINGGSKPGGLGGISDGGLHPLRLTSGAAAPITNYISVNGTAEDVARQVASEIMRTVKRSTKLGSA